MVRLGIVALGLLIILIGIDQKQLPETVNCQTIKKGDIVHTVEFNNIDTFIVLNTYTQNVADFGSIECLAKIARGTKQILDKQVYTEIKIVPFYEIQKL